MDCPENRCPLCWYEGIDNLIEDGESYCQQHNEELR